MPNQDVQGSQLNAVINPKLHFLAKLAAREKGQNLVDFIEYAFAQALSRQAMEKGEPNVNEPTEPMQSMPLWNEALWVDTGKPQEDEIARLFKVGTEDVTLLAPKQRSLFHHIITELVKQGRNVTLTNFVGFIDYSGSGA